MKEQFIVEKPEDFTDVINVVLAQVADSPEGNLVVALEGDLGAGKTTFTQELGKALGVQELITSPTFTIMKQYDLGGSEVDSLVHIDAYRIESEEELSPLHIESIMKQPKTIVCVEWPEQIRGVVPSDALKISISIIEDEKRVVTISPFK
jgi:tRNA threonylcarbamoyladenosine biosynthesis protein TsaE